MIRKALKWMFYLWLLAGILPLIATWASRTVSEWSASRPALADARIRELADRVVAGELTADDLEAALLELTELQNVEEAEPASPTPAPPPRPSPTTFAEHFQETARSIAAATAPEPDPTTLSDIAAARAEAEAAIAEVDVLYREWIAVLEAVAEAHTDYWEKRWAQDKVTNTESARRSGLRDLRLRMVRMTRTRHGEWQKYERTETLAKLRQSWAREGRAEAEQLLAVIRAEAPPPASESPGPTGQPVSTTPR